MMEILVEKPLTILLAGGLLFIVLLMFGLRSGKRPLLIAAAIVFVITAGLLVVERVVESQPEALRRTLREIAAAVSSHDVDKLLEYVHSSAASIRENVQTHYNTYAPQSATITKFVNVQPLTEDTARVSFTVRVTLPDQSPVAYVITDMRKEGDRWKVAGYSVRPLQEAFMEQPKDGAPEPLPPSEY